MIESIFTASLWNEYEIPTIKQDLVENIDGTVTLNTESSHAPNKVQMWSSSSLVDKRDWRLDVLVGETNKACNVLELLALAQDITFLSNPFREYID